MNCKYIKAYVILVMNVCACMLGCLVTDRVS